MRRPTKHSLRFKVFFWARLKSHKVYFVKPCVSLDGKFLQNPTTATERNETSKMLIFLLFRPSLNFAVFTFPHLVFWWWVGSAKLKLNTFSESWDVMLPEKKSKKRVSIWAVAGILPPSHESSLKSHWKMKKSARALPWEIVEWKFVCDALGCSKDTKSVVFPRITLFSRKTISHHWHCR